jgi:hypothetical protein
MGVKVYLHAPSISGTDGNKCQLHDTAALDRKKLLNIRLPEGLAPYILYLGSRWM